MAEKISVLIADDCRETRQNLCRLLLFDDKIDVVGEAANGQEAIELVQELEPDLVLMDINMPDIDGLEATKQISLNHPQSAVIIISVQGEMEYLRRAMTAGARDYLIKPFTGDELHDCVNRVYNLERRRHKAIKLEAEEQLRPQGQIITVYSTKGGVGKTTVSVNLAVSLAARRKRVCLVDLDLQFGDVAVFMNLYPQRTIGELVQEIDQLEKDLLQSYLLTHRSGVDVLPAPLRPEYAEYVQPEHVRKLLDQLMSMYEFVIIDTPASFHETVLAALDVSNKILVLTTLDLPTIKNVKLALEVMESLEYPAKKISVVMNKADAETGIRYKDVNRALSRPVQFYIHKDEPTAQLAANQGEPFVLSQPTSKLSRRIDELGQLLTGELSRKEAKKLEKKLRRWAK